MRQREADPFMTFTWRSTRALATFICIYTAALTQPWTLGAQSSRRDAPAGAASISADDMRAWLGYLASDELQGRQVFTEGYGLAAQYVASHLASWGVKPLGANGTFLQPVRLRGYRSTRNSSVTLTVDGQPKTFKHGDHVTFAANAGGKQTLTFDSVEFLGYGQPADLQGKDLKGKLVVMVPNLAPPPARGTGPGRGAEPPPASGNATGAAPAAGNAAGAPPAAGNTAGTQPAAGAGRGGRGGAAGAIAAGAAALLAFTPPPAAPSPADQALAQAQAALAQATAALTKAQQAARGGRGGAAVPAGRGAQQQPAADFTTVQRVDTRVTPQFTGDETFFEALFAGSPLKFAEIKARAEKGEPLQPVSFRAAVTVAIDNTYEVISQQVTHNVAGLVEGTDPTLKDTYILVGAHLDHVGYSQTGAGRGSATDACRRRGPAAQAAVTAAGRTVQRPTAARGQGAPANAARGAAPPQAPFDERDVISNGADDDASGSTTLLAVARAFATGPMPKRSLVFVWHAGEESGLYGSRYNADFPVVPLEKIQATLNLDMVGRDDCDNIEGDYSNTVFVVGADRISTDLHNIIVETNLASKTPMTLDYELNDPEDPENVYTRSDHFSYAAKGIPVAFFTTGLHPDYHRVSDSAAKIQYAKMARIAQLVYQTGLTLANRERPLERDNKGPRTGFGAKAQTLPK
jgi:hypothetical protein